VTALAAAIRRAVTVTVTVTVTGEESADGQAQG
jgi:hypothetical protein